MKNNGSFLQIAIVAVFAASNLLGSSSSVAASRKKPHVTRNNNVMVLEYDFEEPDITTEGDIDFVTIGGFNRYSKSGEPVIPVKPVEILVPAGMKIEKITSQAIDTCQLPDSYRLSHGGKPFRKDLGPPKTPTKPNPEIFGMTAFWPVEQHDLVTVQTNRGYDIAHVNLFPLQYSPKPGKIKMATKMRLTVRLAGADFYHRAKPTEDLKKRLKRKLDNPDTMESYDEQAPLLSTKGEGDPLSDPEGPYYGENWKYVVITNSTLAAISDQYSFQGLCDSKIARGISAGIVTTDWILATYDGTRPDGGTDDQTKIRNFLIDAYETWGTEYALLGGTSDIIPIRYFDNPNGGVPIPADIYYGCVDPVECTFDYNANGIYAENEWDEESIDGPGGGDVDLTGDIAVGRAAVEDADDVINFVRKTLVYGTSTDAYLDHALTSGAYLGFGGAQEFSKPFCELVRLGSDLYLGHHTAGFESMGIANARYFDVATLYDMDAEWVASELYAILNGTGDNTTPQLIYCGDHGTFEWGMARLYVGDLPTNLTNMQGSGRPFFFYDDSCAVGSFDEDDCFSEEITTIEDGAFACITNSRAGWGADYDNLDSVTTQLTREFFHSVLGEGILELGCAHAEAKASTLWRLCYYDTYQSTLFGDPELQLRVTNDIPTCDYTCGDIDGSGGNIDMGDFAELSKCWSVDPISDPSCICANLVEFDDHKIDILDLSVLAELFLSSSPDYPPNNCSPSMTDPCPPIPDPMAFSSAPAADGNRSIAMTAARTIDFSGVEYFFDCTTAGGHDSGWQECRVYKDTGLAHATEYTYTVKARDKSAAQNQTAASAPASETTDPENLVLPANGGDLEFFTSEYGGGWNASDLTNGTTCEAGWCSTRNPSVNQEFVYSFRGDNNATLNEAIIHGGTAEGLYYSKNVEVWTSANGSSYTLRGNDTLLKQNNDSVTIDLEDVTAKKVKLRITSGYRSDYWELAEFVVYGEVID